MSAPSKEQFYQSLNADTWCGWDWCRKLYGYQVTDADFLQRVYARLSELNRDRVKHIYTFFVKTQIAHEMAQDRDAGRGMVEEIDKNYERQVKECRKNLQNMSDSELLKKLQEVRAERRRFVTVAEPDQ